MTASNCTRRLQPPSLRELIEVGQGCSVAKDKLAPQRDPINDIGEVGGEPHGDSHKRSRYTHQNRSYM
jgi:hypothetical protein